MRISDWSSDVCSSDLALAQQLFGALLPQYGAAVDLRRGAGLPAGGERIECDHRQSFRRRIDRRRQSAGTTTYDEHIRRCAIGKQIEPKARRKSSEEHTSELQSLMRISYAVFCLKKTTRRIQCTEQPYK